MCRTKRGGRNHGQGSGARTFGNAIDKLSVPVGSPWEAIALQTNRKGEGKRKRKEQSRKTTDLGKLVQ